MLSWNRSWNRSGSRSGSRPVARVAGWSGAIAFTLTTHVAGALACPLSDAECSALIAQPSELGEAYDAVAAGALHVVYREVSEADDAVLVAAGDLVVNAPSALVWSVVTDFGAWPAFIPNLDAVEIEAAEGDVVRVHEHTSALGMRFSFTTLRTIDASRMLLWDQLDHSRPSDFAGMSSFWQLLPLDAERTLVRLHTRIKPGFYIPGFLRRKVLGGSVPASLEALAEEVMRRADLAVAAR